MQSLMQLLRYTIRLIYQIIQAAQVKRDKFTIVGIPSPTCSSSRERCCRSVSRTNYNYRYLPPFLSQNQARIHLDRWTARSFAYWDSGWQLTNFYYQLVVAPLPHLQRSRIRWPLRYTADKVCNSNFVRYCYVTGSRRRCHGYSDA